MTMRMAKRVIVSMTTGRAATMVAMGASNHKEVARMCIMIAILTVLTTGSVAGVFPVTDASLWSAAETALPDQVVVRRHPDRRPRL